MGLGGFGMGEMVFIFLIVLLLFGAKRLPEIGSSLGKGIREFKSSVRDIEKELSVPEQRQIHRPTPPPPAAGTTPPAENADGEPRKLSDGGSTPSAEEKP
jgi:sec-independent protein translocase protein TatA